MEKKCQVDDSVSFSDEQSHGLSLSTRENKTNIQNQRGSEVSAISSEKVHSAQQTSVRSDISSEAGEPINNDRKDTDAGRGEVSQVESTKTASSPHEQLKTLSSSSKESGDLIQQSSVDSIHPKQCLSSNYNTASGHSHSSERSLCVLQEPGSYHLSTKADSIEDSMRSEHVCKFDLNEGMEANGAEYPQQPFLKSSFDTLAASEPIPVVAKVGVPIGQPNKQLHFDGELGWRSSATTSAFRPTLSKTSNRENGASCGSRQSLASQGIDLNIAATMDSEPHTDQNSVDISSNQKGTFPLDLNFRSENGENHHKESSSAFDLNDNPAEDTCKNISQMCESRQISRNCIAAGSTVCSRGSGSQSIPDARRPSCWVDLSSMPGFNHFPSRPFLVAAPTAEQVRMVVPIQSEISFLPHAPSGLHIDKVHSLPPAFYPPHRLPHLNNQHPASAVISHLSGSVVAAYPGAIHVIDSRQVLYPTAYATPIRPTFGQNGNLALMENGSRGVEFLVPARNALFEERMKPVERVALPPSSTKRREPDGGWDCSQVNCRPMASWN